MAIRIRRKSILSLQGEAGIVADGGDIDVGGIIVAAFEVASAEVAVALSCGRSRARWRIAAGARV